MFASTSPGSDVDLLTGYAAATGARQSAVLMPFSLPIESLTTANGRVYGTEYTSFGRFGNNAAFALDPGTGDLVWAADLFMLAVTPGTAVTSDPREGFTAPGPQDGRRAVECREQLLRVSRSPAISCIPTTGRSAGCRMVRSWRTRRA